MLAGAAAFAQTAAPTSPPNIAPSAPPAPTSGPSTPAPATPGVAAPSLTAPNAPPVAIEPEQAPGVPSDAVTETLTIAPRPAALVHGSAKWEEGFASIKTSLGKVTSEVDKAGLKPAGHPFAVFLETDDNGFRYDAMVPLADKPEGKEQLSDDVKLGASPAGKAIKFQHRGAYDDIDSTYDLITAFLDEKGLEAQNLFIEEYLTDLKSSDDPGLEVDIYVFIK